MLLLAQQPESRNARAFLATEATLRKPWSASQPTACLGILGHSRRQEIILRKTWTTGLKPRRRSSWGKPGLQAEACVGMPGHALATGANPAEDRDYQLEACTGVLVHSRLLETTLRKTLTANLKHMPGHMLGYVRRPEVNLWKI